jgi:hypothetical protein
MRLIAYYAKSEFVAAHYAASAFARQGERLVPIGRLRREAQPDDEIVIVGRWGNTHHADIRHVKLLTKLRGVNGEDVSVVCFDWHHDLDNEPGGTALTAGSWVAYGLEQGLFGNAYIIGANPRIDNEVDPETREPLAYPGVLLRLLDRLRLFPTVPGPVFLRYDPRYEPVLTGHPSIADYAVAPDRRSVRVTYRGPADIDYSDLRRWVFASVDLDVLAPSEVRSDCPQGRWTVEELLRAIADLRQRSSIIGWAICGMDVRKAGRLDATSLTSISRVIAACTQAV